MQIVVATDRLFSQKISLTQFSLTNLKSMLSLKTHSYLKVDKHLPDQQWIGSLKLLVKHLQTLQTLKAWGNYL